MSANEREKAKHEVITVEQPPTTIFGILSRLGPGLIIAGSIVGSGELIATTATGAQAGFWLLWLIVIGCVIKVFVQVEFGRYTILHGKTSLTGMDEVPGPAIELMPTGRRNSTVLRGNWFLWYWVVVFFVSIGQLGGIVGGVGQAMQISMPLTSYGRLYNSYVDAETQLTTRHAELHWYRERAAEGESRFNSDVERLQREILQFENDSVDHLLQLKLTAAANQPPSPSDPIARAESSRLEAEIEQLRVLDRRLDEIGEPSAEMLSMIATLRPLLVQTAELEQTVERLSKRPDDAGLAEKEKALRANVERLTQQYEQLERQLNLPLRDAYHAARSATKPPAPHDDKLWAAIIAVITAVVLVMGRYRFIQSFSTVLVASFTLITIVNLIALQMNETYAVSWSEIASGLRFQLTPKTQALGISPLATALMTFGIIGVGGNELVSYPYWCMEKGYARFTGPRENSAEWIERARGWLRVMRWDAWCSMVVYTFATIAFYLLGAAILHRIRLSPEGAEMIRTLAVMYEPVFGKWTQMLFLFGAFAVLYSTFFVANASHARVFPDALRVFGLGAKDDRTYRARIRFFSGVFPILCLIVYVLFPKPTVLVLASGAMQAMMLPMLSAGALYFRYFRCDAGVKPSWLWDVFLWLSTIGMLVAGGWLALTIVFPGLKELG